MLRKLAGIVELCGRHWHPQVLATSSQMPDVLATLEKLGQSTVCMNLAGSRRNITTSARVWGELFEFPLAQTGEGIAECEIIKWLVKEGDQVSRFQKICEIQSDKASMDITSPYEGRVRQVHYSSGDVVKVGETLITIESDSVGGTVDGSQALHSNSSQPSHESNVKNKDQRARTEKKTKAVATPSVRNLIKESGVNVESVVGSGEDGRILREDVLAAIGLQGCNEKPSLQEPTGEPKGYCSLEPIRIPIRGYRRAMVKSMNQAATIPHFHLCDEVSMGSLLSMRAPSEESSQVPQPRLTVLPFIIKALSIALRTFPDLNASLSGDQSEILQYQHHNVGIAMATPEGLVVPNIKNVQTLSIGEIGQQIVSLKQKALAGKLTGDDVAGGTITVSNIGTIGGIYATPLVSHPEVAIVALGKIRNIPVVSRIQGGTPVESKAFMPITWGADHRVADGAMLATCNNLWKRLVEQPEQVLLHLR